MNHTINDCGFLRCTNNIHDIDEGRDEMSNIKVNQGNWKQNNSLFMLLIMMISLLLLSCDKNIDDNLNSNVSNVLQNDIVDMDKNQTSNSIDTTDNNRVESSSVTEFEENTEEDGYDKEIIELIKKANGGDADAQNTLAYYYFNGYGVEQDYDKSLEWSIKSAEGGNLASMFNVGYNYYHGFTGDVNYELAFKWYEKAADKMFPKALNALGHMYYEGLGIEQDIDKAIDYTLQSTGFLHNYSLSNMGAIIDELGLEQDSNYWYRLSSKNYMIHSGSKEILYDNLVNGKVDVDTEYLIDSEDIPEELIQDILFKFYSGTLYEYLDTSSMDYKKFDLNELNMNEETRSMISPHWWYDSSYFADVNSDGIEELIIFQLDGTVGISSFQVLESIDGEYVVDEESIRTTLMHGINGLITFNNEKFFIVANIDIGNRSIFGVSIYSFNDCLLSDSVIIKVVEEDTRFIKTYQSSEEYNSIVEVVETRINEMFVEKYNSLVYENVNESMIIDVDIDNNGDIEHFEYEAIFYGTINRPLSIDFRTGLTSEDDLKAIEKILNFNDLGVPIGLETFSLEEINYVSVLSYELGTNNHCLTTFKIENDEVLVISNHLILYDEKFIISDENSFFN